jgi:7-cyano-7-deazaguanine synthase in queuosine biosynthesis
MFYNKELPDQLKDSKYIWESPRTHIHTTIPPRARLPHHMLICCSGGLDSVGLVLWAKQNGICPLILFADGLNATINYRERKAVKDICAILEMDYISFKVPHVDRSFRTKHDLIEHPCKNHIMLEWARERGLVSNVEYLAFSNERGTFGNVWSDSTHAYQCAAYALGWKLIHPFQTKKDTLLYIRDSAYPELWKYSASCFMRAQFFSVHQSQSGAPSNMCGRCCKCKRIWPLLQELSMC